MALITSSAIAASSSFDQSKRNELDLLGLSYHMDREAGYNEFNLGLVYKRKYYHRWWLNAGGYRNSNYKMTWTVGVMYRWPLSKKLDINIYANILTGYRHDIVGHFELAGERIVPVILPTLTYDKWLNMAAYPVDGGGVAVSFTVARW